MQGFNMGRYVPPELEGRISFNRASGKGHALGGRARKLASDGILTVRFECPFAIWCATCDPEQIIGQGVRFNAEKKKVGNYYSTPIWQFRFKHSVCGGWLEVRTDPKASEYMVVEGGRRRDYGEGRRGEEWGVVAGVSEEEKARLENEGGFGVLEKKVDEKKERVTQQMRVQELVKASERDWADPYERSQALRREFRVGRRKRQEDGRTGTALQERFGLGVELLETTHEDTEKAAKVNFGEVKRIEAAGKPLFAESQPFQSLQQNGRGPAKTGKALAHQKSALQGQLKSNTRANHDPFPGEDAWQRQAKRRKADDESSNVVIKPQISSGASLVTYDSE
ncbi:uncharacterized protein HMPREF1541_05520 [Cyphellophora europaea CBS 101466]|uniref:Uncharacterized protein n=1 Tax=Cyphellophora europaea (strain CBS 101466) TaxID=1220924 RepID=W2RS67_CYPE1|nr:uncharacterized protein HMPREF1541_05520 [Cyphellophora europaea CBS 101466]ETN39297.1 hypothetical protein HMPREF1541_05520 [Cyphellophora europaea CBS 101466]